MGRIGFIRECPKVALRVWVQSRVQACTVQVLMETEMVFNDANAICHGICVEIAVKND